jgi:hypothetical protein
METAVYATTLVASSACVKGRTLRFAWTDGPTAGRTHEHHFHDDGTVDWKAVDGEGSGRPATPKERPEYFAADVGSQACFVSYLASSGYTLSVVIDFATGTVVGVASNQSQWTPVRGRLESSP